VFDMTNRRGYPDYRIELSRGLTLAWDVMTYGVPNEENVRKFINEFGRKCGGLSPGPKKLVDQNSGEVLVEITEPEEGSDS
jgi:hypothetical protein